MASLFEAMIFSRFKKFKKVCLEKKFISSMSDLFSSAAAFLLRSERAGERKNVSMPCIVAAFVLFGAAFAWMEIKRSAALSLAYFVRSRRLINLSLLRV